MIILLKILCLAVLTGKIMSTEDLFPVHNQMSYVKINFFLLKII